MGLGRDLKKRPLLPIRMAMPGLSLPLRVFVAVATCALLLSVFPVPAGAQYGGVSGLFVVTSPDTPGFADFTGLGCQGGDEVVLYMPGIAPTSTDPTTTKSSADHTTTQNPTPE